MRGFPGGVVSDHGVEDEEEFSHAGDECDHFALACGDEAFVERADDGVASCSDEGGHVQGVADGDASAAGGSFAAHESGVAVDGRHADELGDLLAVESSEFGEFGDEDGRGGRADAWRGAEEFLPLLKIGTPIVPAQLLNRAGIVGAALVAQQELR